ncbi:MAG TPA: hypothetical protein PLK13_17495 [Xanthobacteraceae bacterium]|jgi:hypothetical protein|nr:hypothetical protein [Xanthobacteraceae bacterium]HQS48346.1 hypothetical protein [Xanthobacteraceae bacterium]
MSANYNSSFTQNLSVSQAESSDDGVSLSTDSVAMALDVSTGPTSSDEAGMALSLGGDATAVGQDTLATASVEALVVGDESVQTAYGNATFTAWGEGDGTAYASAVSYGDVTGEADHAFSLNYTSTVSSVDGDAATWAAIATTEVFALDIEGIPFAPVTLQDEAADPGPGTEVLVPLPDPVPDYVPDCGCGTDDSWAVEVDGNLAIFDVTAVAVGDNSLAQVDFFALTVEDQLSTVTVVVTAAID